VNPGGYSSFITATMLMGLYKLKERCHLHDVLEMHGLFLPVTALVLGAPYRVTS
jgi:hypothetical protein